MFRIRRHVSLGLAPFWGLIASGNTRPWHLKGTFDYTDLENYLFIYFTVHGLLFTAKEQLPKSWLPPLFWSQNPTNPSPGNPVIPETISCYKLLEFVSLSRQVLKVLQFNVCFREFRLISIHSRPIKDLSNDTKIKSIRTGDDL